MTRPHRILTADFPYHITARCTNRDWFRLPMEQVWPIFEDYLYLAHHRDGLRIHAFVLMSNHFHLLASTPQANLSEIMAGFMTGVSREITRISCRINQTFGGPYHASLVRGLNYYMHAYRYAYRNPVDAGILTRAEDYRFSTLAGLIGRTRLIIPMPADHVLNDDLPGVLEWINSPYRDGEREQVRRALRRKEFELPRDRVTRRPVEIAVLT